MIEEPPGERGEAGRGPAGEAFGGDETPGADEPAGLAERLASGDRPLLLDGATGTELERAGLKTGLPLWSTHALIEAPEQVREVHRRYAAAGAEILTANTFRTQERTLRRAGLTAPARRARALTRLAVRLAREAAWQAAGQATRDAPRDAPREGTRERGAQALGAGARPPWVAGSQPPLEDCYRPDLVPDPATLEREHVRHAGLLAQAGVDLILVETMGTLREARIAVTAARATGRPVVASFVSWERGRILSGESLAEAAASVLEAGALAVGVNCVPPSTIPGAIASLAALEAPLLLAPNLGEPEDEKGFARSEDVTPAAFAALFEGWLEAAGAWSPATRVALVGGCCGTTPDHTAALARGLRSLARRSGTGPVPPSI